MELVLEQLGKTYGEKKVLENISLSLKGGEILALVGPNGSGKSTLIKTITLIHEPTAGGISLDGTDITKMDPINLAMKVGYVPQHFTYSLYSTVFETVLLGRRRHIQWSVSDEEISRVQSALDSLEMGELAGKFMDQLSGGERQKVFIARALAQNPSLFLFDEPTSALDIRYQLEVMNTMRRITREQNSSLIIAVHDLNLAYRYADRVLVLSNGSRAGYGTPKEVLTPDLIRSVYGVESAIVDHGTESFFLPLNILSAS